MINLQPEYLGMLKEIFTAYCPQAEIWGYGSRIGGDSHEGSDLDLAVKTFGDATKSIDELNDLLNDSDIPFLIDLHEFDRLPVSFQSEILKNYVVLFGGAKREE